MRLIRFFTDPFYNNDRLFDQNDPVSNRDGCLEHFVQFRVEAEKRGFSVHTSDFEPTIEAEYNFYLEMPSGQPCSQGKNFLFLLESPVVRPDNWDLLRHAAFDRIFTWSDKHVDGTRYYKLNTLVPSRSLPEDSFNTGKRLLTQISGNKFSTHPNQLYSRRVDSIRWWERHFPEDFKFYGTGWETPVWSGPFWNLNRYPWLRSFAPPFRCYGGPVANKLEALNQNRFSLCYENATGYPGYITEKILDCFAAGTVPIYWGSEGTEKHIPKGCFVDRTLFVSEAELRRYLLSVSDREYSEFMSNIRSFLSSEAMVPFLSPAFSATVLPHLE